MGHQFLAIQVVSYNIIRHNEKLEKKTWTETSNQSFKFDWTKIVRKSNKTNFTRKKLAAALPVFGILGIYGEVKFKIYDSNVIPQGIMKSKPVEVDIFPQLVALNSLSFQFFADMINRVVFSLVIIVQVFGWKND